MTTPLMEKVLERNNMMLAYKKVKANKGASVMDGIGTEEIRDYLIENWPSIRERIIKRKYKPQPVLRVEIPKPNGGVRKLGLKVNATKTKVTRPMNLKYLGFSFVKMDGKWEARPHRDSIENLKIKLKKLAGRSWPLPMDERIQRLN